MRPELELIEKIAQYLSGELSPDEARAFDILMANDPLLREAVAAQQAIMQGINRAGIRQEVQRAGTRYHIGKRLSRWGIYGGTGLIIAAAGFLLFQKQLWHTDKKTIATSAYNGTQLPTLNEQGTKDWATADSLIPAQVFSITTGYDTVIETKGGMVLAIPANALLTQDGKAATGAISLCIKEALDPLTIMTARLSTMSGSRLLETGGMFFLDARQANELLHINPNNQIYAEIPTQEIKAGMQLFSGKRMPGGSINWINPVPLPQDLAALDINGLDFYPPNYLQLLSKAGYPTTNKRFTDSVYFSLAALFSDRADLNSDDGVVEVDGGYDSQSKDSVYTLSDTSNGRSKGAYTLGKTLFQANCATCHNPLKDATGPALGGKSYSWPSRQWVYDWVRNPSGMIAKGDKHALELFDKYKPTVMTAFPKLKNEEIAAIIQYADEYDGMCGINPAKIKAIWNNQYQNTLLATREFEQRLKFIHQSKDPELLDLYVTNLDKALYQIDSMAAMRTSGNIKAGFSAFYALKNGRVKRDSKCFEKLRDYYAQKTRLFTEAAAAAVQKMMAQEQQAAREAKAKTLAHTADNAARIERNFAQELELNLERAYAQLGKVRPIASASFAVTITNTGWNNVDRYVLEATANRTTLDYTDPESGKKAVIEYKPISVTIDNAKSYDRLLVYLLPDKLSSFMAMNETDGLFTEKQNGLMKYELVCMGIKGSQYSFLHVSSVQAKAYESLKLTAIDSASLQGVMSSLRNVGQGNAVRKEIEYAVWDLQNIRRQTERLKWQALIADLRAGLFDCGGIK